MQLILDTEPTLAIEKDMSAIEDIHMEKVGNGDIEKLNAQKCNGNKENIEVNFSINDDLNKQVINAEVIALPDIPIVLKSEITEVDSNNGVAIEETCEVNNVEANGAQTEESQNNGIDEENKIIDTRAKKSEEKSEETAQEVTVKNEEDIISINQENLNQIVDMVDKELENVISETDVPKIKEELPNTKDDVEVIKEPSETPTICETIPDEEVDESATTTTENKDKHLESSENKDKHLESSENKEKQLESSENKDKQLDDSKNVSETPECVSTEAISNNNADDSSSLPIELKDDMDEEEVAEEKKSDEQDTALQAKEISAPVSGIIDKPIAHDSSPIELKDDMDVEEVVGATKSNKQDNALQAKETSAPVGTIIDKHIAHDSSPIELKDDIDVEEVVEATKSNKQDTALQAKETSAPVSTIFDKPIAHDSAPIELKDDMEVEEVEATTSNKQDSALQAKETSAPVSSITDKPIEHDSSPIELKDDMDVEEVVEATKSDKQDSALQAKETPSAPISSIIDKPILCKLSNTLDILSDDEEEPPKEEPPKIVDSNEKQCINIEDDDDIMLIDEDTSKTETLETVDISNKEEVPINTDDKTNSETGEKAVEETIDLFSKTDNKDSAADINDTSSQINISEKQEEKRTENFEADLPLLPDNFLKTAKKNLSDMTREDLEEFCILKIVESIVDRSNLSEIKNKLKSVAQGIEEYRKKAMMLTKQNRDLQVVLKSIQEEQKKMRPDTPITPLKITRSVGMQVFMEKTGARRKNLSQLQNPNNNNLGNRQNAKTLPVVGSRPQKPAAPNQAIPVPRLVPANSPAMKSPNTIPLVNQITPGKTITPMPNGIKNQSPSQKAGDKRQHNRIMSVTVDLTDDEPPAKINNRTSPAPPVRVVPAQNLMATPRQAFQAPVSSSPRKVYIPISGPQNQGLRPGQTIMLKSVPTPGLRPRCPNPQVARMPTGAVRMNRIQTGRHPAPLPDAMKQYQPPNWKALPPAPDLKLSKVENGIVISWKIEAYQEDSYEEIASYQLYAYQETSSPPSTALWKKIGDVKALPLPMACTLTQFMAGFKYYFAVRAVDIRSRLGPFSLPGSILLLNKL